MATTIAWIAVTICAVVLLVDGIRGHKKETTEKARHSPTYRPNSIIRSWTNNPVTESTMGNYFDDNNRAILKCLREKYKFTIKNNVFCVLTGTSYVELYDSLSVVDYNGDPSQHVYGGVVIYTYSVSDHTGIVIMDTIERDVYFDLVFIGTDALGEVEFMNTVIRGFLESLYGHADAANSCMNTLTILIRTALPNRYRDIFTDFIRERNAQYTEPVVWDGETNRAASMNDGEASEEGSVPGSVVDVMKSRG